MDFHTLSYHRKLMTLRLSSPLSRSVTFSPMTSQTVLSNPNTPWYVGSVGFLAFLCFYQLFHHVWDVTLASSFPGHPAPLVPLVCLFLSHPVFFFSFSSLHVILPRLLLTFLCLLHCSSCSLPFILSVLLLGDLRTKKFVTKVYWTTSSILSFPSLRPVYPKLPFLIFLFNPTSILWFGSSSLSSLLVYFL
jgi:hypothetical protein